jgi:hypothetical protein
VFLCITPVTIISLLPCKKPGFHPVILPLISGGNKTCLLKLTGQTYYLALGTKTGIEQTGRQRYQNCNHNYQQVIVNIKHLFIM